MIAVTNSIQNTSVEVSRYDEVGQALLRHYKKQITKYQKIRIGAVYGP